MDAVVFPGQGSQHTGMGKFLFDEFKSVRESFELASDTLSLDFKKLCFEGPEEELTLTHNTQPALVLVSSATYSVLKETTGFAPQLAAGHSVGEYSAMVATEAMKLEDAITAVRKRGEFMQSAVPVGEGGMAAVMGLDEKQVEQLCTWAQEETGLSPVEPANFNSPGQIVISGKQKLIEWLRENFKNATFDPAPKKLRVIPLKVSAPFHCSMMKPAQEKMEIVLGDIPFSDANIPVVQNVTAQQETTADNLRSKLVEQISAPVKWSASLETMKAAGVSRMIESGSGKVLSGLTAKTLGDAVECFNINSLDDLKTIEGAFNG